MTATQNLAGTEEAAWMVSIPIRVNVQQATREPTVTVSDELRLK